MQPGASKGESQIIQSKMQHQHQSCSSSSNSSSNSSSSNSSSSNSSSSSACREFLYQKLQQQAATIGIMHACSNKNACNSIQRWLVYVLTSPSPRRPSRGPLGTHQIYPWGLGAPHGPTCFLSLSRAFYYIHMHAPECMHVRASTMRMHALSACKCMHAMRTLNACIHACASQVQRIAACTTGDQAVLYACMLHVDACMQMHACICMHIQGRACTQTPMQTFSGAPKGPPTLVFPYQVLAPLRRFLGGAPWGPPPLAVGGRGAPPAPSMGPPSDAGGPQGLAEGALAAALCKKAIFSSWP